MKMWKRLAATLSMMLVAAVALAGVTASAANAQGRAPAGPAQPQAHPAGTSDGVKPLATNLTYRYWGNWSYAGNTVDIWWGFDYSPATNHLRGWAEMSGSSTSIHVQAEPLNLGDRNGVLASARANSQTGFLEVSTAAVNCHYPNGVYLSNLHYSIRWPDGTLTSGKETGQFEASASVICT
jgi:hypothetical protein